MLTSCLGECCSVSPIVFIIICFSRFPLLCYINKLSSTCPSDIKIFNINIVNLCCLQDSEDWQSPDSAPYIWALCVPSSCSASDVQSYFNAALNPLNVENRVQVLLNVLPENCLVADQTDVQFTGAEIGFM